MQLKRLTINKSDASRPKFVDFFIPKVAGKYNLSFSNDNGQTLNAGNIVVDQKQRRYPHSFLYVFS